MGTVILNVVLLMSVLCQELGGSDGVETKILRLCVSQNSCESCLQASSSCAWCSDWSYSNSTIGRPRCNVPERLKEFGCSSQEIRTTPPGLMEFLEDSDFQDMEQGRIPIQLRPQRIKNLVAKIKQARWSDLAQSVIALELMDLTWSMKDDKDTLVSLGWDMSRRLGRFTTNYRLGFGSYADKPLMPFIFPGHEDNPCKSEHTVCSPVYSYWHHLELTKDVHRFIKEVNDSLVTGNVDNLEGALDGIVQTIVCTEEIAWQRQARKIILVATDGHMHFASEQTRQGTVYQNGGHIVESLP